MMSEPRFGKGDKIVVLFSGGLDSATLLYRLQHDYPEASLLPLFVNYGQRNYNKELFATGTVTTQLREKMGKTRGDSSLLWETRTVRVEGLRSGGSALLDSEIHLDEGGLKPAALTSSFVPGRNLMFLSLAAQYADAVGARAIGMALVGRGPECLLGWKIRNGKMVKVYSFPYPDCSPAFADAFQASWRSSSGAARFLLTPYIHAGKDKVVMDAIKLGVNQDSSWSCFEPFGPCHKCIACQFKRRALNSALDQLYCNLRDE